MAGCGLVHMHCNRIVQLGMSPVWKPEQRTLFLQTQAFDYGYKAQKQSVSSFPPVVTSRKAAKVWTGSSGRGVDNAQSSYKTNKIDLSLLD